jgi:hypothetical protein
MRIVFILLVLAAFAVVSSAQEEFPASDWKVVSEPSMGAYGFVKKNFAGTQYCLDGSNYDAVTGKHLDGFPVGQARDVEWDKFGNAWVASNKGLKYCGLSDTVTYTVSDGLPANSLRTLEYDSANNRLIVGADSGLSIIKLDASGKPVSFQNILGDYGFHKVGSYGEKIVAVNSQYFFYYDCVNWNTFDKNNSPVSEPRGSFVSEDGIAYVGSKVTEINGQVYVATFDMKSGTFGKIELPSDFDGYPITSLVVNSKNQLWFSDFVGLVKFDLAAKTVVKKFPLDGSVVDWLNIKGSSVSIPVLGLTEGRLLIGGNGAIVEEKSANAIRNLVFAPKLSRENFQVIGVIDPLGRKIAVNFNSFSAPLVPSVSGNYFIVYRSASGITKVEKNFIAK